MAVEAPGELSRPGLGWQFWLRIVVSGALLALLLSKTPDFGAVIPEQHHVLTVALLVAALAMTFLGVVLSAWRWQRVLHVFDKDVPLRKLTSIYLAGLFVGNALPSTIGGDVVRIARAGRVIDSQSTAFGSVVVERLTGFVALPLLVFAGFLWDRELIDVSHAWLALSIASASLVLLMGLLIVAGHPRLAGRFNDKQSWTRFIGAVHIGVDRLRRDPKQTFRVLVSAVVYQVSVVLSVAVIFRSLELGVPLAAVFVYIPAVMMLQVMPISLNGIGVREAALVLFLEPFGVERAQAIAAGLLWFTATLLVSMLGAPSFIIGQRRAPAPAVATAEERTS